MLVGAVPSRAEDGTLRVLTFNTGLDRKGPGLLVRDLMRDDPVTLKTLQRVTEAAPDVAVLQSVDFDRDMVAVRLLQKQLKVQGLDLPYSFARPPNTGVGTGVDLDRNGRFGEPRDMQGYGRFLGQGGMVVLSRFPILADESRDFSGVLWRDQPSPGLPRLGDGPYFDAAVLEVLRLHSVAAWDLVVRTPRGLLHVLTSHASPPVFDGPEDRNGLRNAAEVRFWSDHINSMTTPFVYAGDLNAAMAGGEGLKPPLRALLAHPKLQDPKPTTHEGAPETVQWDGGLSLRVSYVLPSRHFGIGATQVEWAPSADGATRHHPVWVDLIWK